MPHPPPQETWVSYGSHFLPNGYLVAAPCWEELADVYQGIDDDQWPIESDDNLRKFLNRLGAPQALEGVEVATLWDETYAYWKRCLARGWKARLLLVSTCYTHPIVVPPKEGWKQLGYDVAEPMGQHSVLRHEVITGTAPQLGHWRSHLNAAGLFEDLETAEAFLHERLTVAERNPQGMELSPGFQFVPVLLHLFVCE